MQKIKVSTPLSALDWAQIIGFPIIVFSATPESILRHLPLYTSTCAFIFYFSMKMIYRANEFNFTEEFLEISGGSLLGRFTHRFAWKDGINFALRSASVHPVAGVTVLDQFFAVDEIILFSQSHAPLVLRYKSKLYIEVVQELTSRIERYFEKSRKLTFWSGDLFGLNVGGVIVLERCADDANFSVTYFNKHVTGVPSFRVPSYSAKGILPIEKIQLEVNKEPFSDPCIFSPTMILLSNN